MKAEYCEFKGDTGDAAEMQQIADQVGWGPYTGVEEYQSDIKERMKDNGLRIFTAKKQGKVISFVEVYTKPLEGFEVETGGIYFNAIASTQDKRGQRVTKKFAAHVLQQLSEEGYSAAFSDVQWDNVTSIRFNMAVGGKLVAASPQAVQYERAEPHLRFQFDLAA